MDKRAFVLILCGFYFNLSGATICVANSRFKVDCNFCVCSSDGKHYSCTEDKCLPRNYDNFIVTQNKDGHKLLVPRNNDDVAVSKPRQIRALENIQDVDNSEQLDVEVMHPNDSEESDFIDTNDEEPGSDEINQKIWERLIPKQVPNFPE